MKNFLQFIIPLGIICAIGIVMLAKSKPHDDTKRLYVSCNSISKNFEVWSGIKVFFAEKNEECKLDIEIANVHNNYIKINTEYLWRLDDNGKLDKTEPKSTNIIQIDQAVTLYSYDEKTKYTFEYK